MAYSQVLPGSLPMLCKQFAKGKFKVIVCDRSNQIEDIATRLRFFGNRNIICLPHRDNKLYELTAPSAINRSARLKALHSLLSAPSQPSILITTLKGLGEMILKPEEILANSFKIELDEKLDMQQILQKLQKIGYQHSNTAIELGEFARRGSIIDIIAEHEHGFRVDFFGNKVESIRTFCTQTQRSLKRLSNVTILPVHEYILTPKAKDAFEYNFTQMHPNQKPAILDAVQSGIHYAGIHNYLPLFSEQPCVSLLDYLPEDCVIFNVDENFKHYNKYLKDIEVRYQIRLHASKTESAPLPLKVDALAMSVEKLTEKLSGFNCQNYTEFSAPNSTKIAKSHPSIYQQAMLKKTDYIAEFKQYAADHQQPIIICCKSAASIIKIQNILQKHDLIPPLLNGMDELNTKNNVSIALYPINKSFCAQNVTFLAESDLIGHTTSIKSKKTSSAKAALMHIAEIDKNELVVHKEHGIGKFIGINTIEVKGKHRDFIQLLYADDDKLYIPVENLDLISKYSEDTATIALDKLGALGWQKRKARLKEKIKLQAKALIATAAERISQKALALEPDAELYQKFCQNFPFMETEDQLRAIDETLNDLKKSTPMDRLLCGDVGFGKTEVALRAAFAAVANKTPAQVAIIVPTTLLVRQHYKTFTERFKDFAIKIKQLSKFTNRAEIKPIKDGMKGGEVDIVIGTHALLADGIEFANLALIIIDEEQHFGVKQKEKLKKLKSDAHILTLSATPIPRTLHMSLNDIKSLSLITTPPLERLPVQTYAMPFDALTLRDAIVREKHRNGRVFVVTPRIQYITALTQKIEDISSELNIKIVTAHGQMPAAKLDQIMNDFYDGKYDVLISTSIIESGLDIPQANTIIVDHAHMFGLAQAYQIRGRVGRSNVKSYAYFTYPSDLLLSENARKRLGVLQSLSDLGAGFSIASHDMEIRGYGNLVGEEQSGHVKEVGIELYQDMLAQAINEIKNQADEGAVIDQDWSPILNLGVSVQIPQSYIADSAMRLAFYRRIASIIEQDELNELYDEMIDRFGPPNADTVHLFDIVKLKAICKKNNIAKIDKGQSGILITFRNNKPNNQQKIIDYVAQNPIYARLRPDMKLALKMPKFESADANDLSLDLIKEQIIRLT